MRRLLITSLTAAVIAATGIIAGALTASPAQAAMPVPVGIAATINGERAQPVAYVCRRVWRCSYRGCGWRRSCHWRPKRFWRPRYWHYRYSRPHRYWRRHHRRHW